MGSSIQRCTDPCGSRRPGFKLRFVLKFMHLAQRTQGPSTKRHTAGAEGARFPQGRLQAIMWLGRLWPLSNDRRVTRSQSPGLAGENTPHLLRPPQPPPTIHPGEAQTVEGLALQGSGWVAQGGAEPQPPGPPPHSPPFPGCFRQRSCKKIPASPWPASRPPAGFFQGASCGCRPCAVLGLTGQAGTVPRPPVIPDSLRTSGRVRRAGSERPGKQETRQRDCLSERPAFLSGDPRRLGDAAGGAAWAPGGGSPSQHQVMGDPGDR